MTERWFNEGGTVLDENRLPVAHVVGQDEDDSDAKLIAAAPLMYDTLARAELILADIARNSAQPYIQRDATSALSEIKEVLKEARDR